MILLIGVAFINLGTFLAAPASSPVPADLIVSLGGDGGYRVLEVARLFRAHWAGKILLTGLEDSPPEIRAPYLEWRAMALQKGGVPVSALLFDWDSENSGDEAVNTRRLMEQRGWKRVLVVSDPPHMRRLNWAWHHAFAGSSLEFVLVAAPNPKWHADGWWRDEASAKYVFQETVKLGYYVLVK
jgi:uncharacterized SAM-binding protein YcdF (DUF218 family)